MFEMRLRPYSIRVSRLDSHNTLVCTFVSSRLCRRKCLHEELGYRRYDQRSNENKYHVQSQRNTEIKMLTCTHRASYAALPLPKPAGQGMRTLVSSVYCLQAGSLPHFFSEAASNGGTPDPYLNNK